MLIFLELNLWYHDSRCLVAELIKPLAKGETAKTTIRIDGIALSVARTIKDSNNEYIWCKNIDGKNPDTLMGLEYKVTDPRYDRGITILIETSKGRAQDAHLEPDIKQSFLYR